MESPIITGRVYISGPMSDIPREHYKKRFDLAEQMLRQFGFRNIVNPSRLWICKPWLYRILGYRLTLFCDLWMLTRCSHIYKMPGWRQSRGANIESCVAFHFGLYTIARKLREPIDKAIDELTFQLEA